MELEAISASLLQTEGVENTQQVMAAEKTSRSEILWLSFWLLVHIHQWVVVGKVSFLGLVIDQPQPRLSCIMADGATKHV